MSEFDPQAISETPLDWSDAGMDHEPLPTGTVTLLLADVQGSTQLWDSRPEEMTAAIANLDRTLAELVSDHHGVRPMEQGEGDSFVIAFSKASHAVACALALQQAPLAPLRLRVGVHTGEVQLRDDNNYIGPSINRTARLRELAHGGQTVLSGTTTDLVADTLPADVWLAELGTHQLRDLPRPERVVQLCHPDLCNEFPPLRIPTTPETSVAQHLPAQLTSFVGRDTEIVEVRDLLAASRLVTLTGAGGVGKTRLAVQVAQAVAGNYRDGTWYVDLAPLTEPDLVALTVARALGLPDQPGRSPVNSLLQFVGTRQLLVVLDNCEHLLDTSAALTEALLGACPRLTMLATSREPIGVAGEVTWRVPSLSLADDAVHLFIDRAGNARPDFSTDDTTAAAVDEICRRLDGMPLAIELAAARVRALSPQEILAGLRDRFRLLTGGSRTAVRRQQTLQASVDWSHALLTEPERILFRRLAAFVGGFDLRACQAVVCDKDLARHQVLDQLALLVDKSLVIAETAGGPSRYLLLETMRQYAQEKLTESPEAVAIRDRHCDHYTAMAAALDAPTNSDMGQLLDQAETEIDNLRAAFAWSREKSDTDNALRLAASQRLWLTRGLLREGSDWLDLALADAELAETAGAPVAPAALAQALADKAFLDNMRDPKSIPRAQRALAIARELDDPALLARALSACGRVTGWKADPRPYLAEAAELARAMGDRWRLSQTVYGQAFTAMVGAGDIETAIAAGTEGRNLAEEINDQLYGWGCRWCLNGAQWALGDVAGAEAQQRELLIEADAAHTLIWQVAIRSSLCLVLAHSGQADAARAVALEARGGAAEIGQYMEGVLYAALAFAELAGGDVEAAAAASDISRELLGELLSGLATTTAKPAAQVALARGELTEARRLADADVAAAVGWFTVQALATRARVACAQNEPGQAERDARAALTRAAETRALLFVPDVLECLAGLAASDLEATRLLGAAHAIRQGTGVVRFRIYETEYTALVHGLRNTLSEAEFDQAWDAGAALPTDEAIAYALRGHGERRRPSSGWDALTPTECDVIRLVSEGLGNKDIATRLFISPRTVQTHLTHVYTKLGLTSRVQLAQESARRA